MPRNPRNQPDLLALLALIDDATPPEAEKIMKGIRDRGEEITIEVWMHYVNAYVSANDHTGAHDAVARSLQWTPFLRAAAPRIAADVHRHIDASSDEYQRTEFFRETINNLTHEGRHAPGDRYFEHRLRLRLALSTTIEQRDASHIEQALRETPAEGVPVGVWRDLVDFYAIIGDVDGAERTIGRARKFGHEPTTDNLATLIDAYARRSGPTAAQDVFNRALRDGMRPAEPMMVSLAHAYAVARDLPGVHQVIDHAVDARGQFGAPLWNELNAAYERTADPHGVRITMARMNDWGTKPDGRSWGSLARAQMWLGQIAAGLEACTRALELAPEDPELLSTAMTLAKILGRHEILDDAFDRLISLASPTHRTDFLAALTRLEPLLGAPRTANLIEQAASPDEPRRPRELFAEALEILEPDYGMLVTLVAAFPFLYGSMDVWALIEHDTTPEQLTRAECVLGDRFGTRDGARGQMADELLRKFAAGRTRPELEAAALSGDFDAAELLRLHAKTAGDTARADRMREINPDEVLIRRALGALESDWNVEEGRTRLREAADAGSGAAAFHLALHTDDEHEREGWLLKAHQMGYPAAPAALAALHDSRNDERQASQWAELGANLRNAEALEFKATLADRAGRPEESERLLQLAMAAGGTPGAAKRLAQHALAQGRRAEGESLLTTAAEAYDAEAMRFLAGLLDQNDDQVGYDLWLRRAAEEGDLPAAGMLGSELSTQQRFSEAEHWLRLAAESNLPLAGAQLTEICVFLGRTEEAERWFEWTLTRDDSDLAASLIKFARRNGGRTLARRWRLRAWAHQFGV